MTATFGLAVYFGMVGFLALVWKGRRSPWSDSLGQLASRSWATALGDCPVDVARLWSLPEGWDAEDLAVEIDDHPCVWTDGMLRWWVLVCICLRRIWLCTVPLGVWRRSMEMRFGRCRVFMPVAGPLQSVQRADFGGTILALQAFSPGHLGVGNRAIGELLDHGSLFTPLSLVNDGNLVGID